MLEDAPIVSVVMPVFNAEKYVEDAVRSILRQTFAKFELIIINDGSTDGTLNILKGLEALDERLLLVSRNNLGLVATLNEGIGIARGQWLARMDADDIALPNRLERQLKWLELTGADICGGWVRFFGASDKRILKHSETDEAIRMELLFGSPFAHPTVMVRTHLIRHLRYDKAWEKCEDYDLWERAARAGWSMTNVPEVLLMYRQHEAQISSESSIEQHELTQKIRRRYWNFVFDSMQLEKDCISEVLKLRELTQLKVDMNDVDLAFDVLLQNSTGESRAVIFDHATRLYFRAAARCPDVTERWARMNKQYGEGFALAIKIKLWLLSVLRVNANGRVFFLLKNLYFRYISST